MNNISSSQKAKTSKDCPYIGTVQRYWLDFDFEKVCSISLSNLNIYCCWICGKYFQGCGKSTHAYSHSLSEDHHLFINLKSEIIICLPDNYEVNDVSWNDIKSNLRPLYTKTSIKYLDKNTEYSETLDGSEYLPGYIGLNNIKNNDYVNVVIQGLTHLKKFRNYFLEYQSWRYYKNDDYFTWWTEKLSELTKKMWNNMNFKDHISPHEVLQAISLCSSKRFTMIKQNDWILFLSWFMNALNKYFLQRKIQNNIINDYFTGRLQVETFTLLKDISNWKSTDRIVKIDGIDYIYSKNTTNFYYLTLELPVTPLFKDSNQTINIPQVSISDWIKKYNGEQFTEDPIKMQKRRYSILSLPKYLILIFKRFESNMFFTEKNPTIVNFTLDNFFINKTKYELSSNIIHDGKPSQGSFRIQLRNKSRNEWYEIQDLHVETIMPESVLVSESYIHFYELQKEGSERQDEKNRIIDILRGNYIIFYISFKYLIYNIHMGIGIGDLMKMVKLSIPHCKNRKLRLRIEISAGEMKTGKLKIRL